MFPRKEGTISFLSQKKEDIYEFLSNVDYVPSNLPAPTGRAQLIVCEYNDAVIKMISRKEVLT